jgi:hypothetical protein
MKVLKLVIASTLLLTVARAAAADPIVLFSNLAANDAYSEQRATFFGFDETRTDPNLNFSRAMPFVPLATATLTTLEMPLLTVPLFGHPLLDGTLEVNLFESANGLPGTLLESFSSNGIHLPDQLTVFQSTLQPLLQAGSLYFLEARAIGETNGLWYLTVTDPAAVEPDFRRRGEGPWEVGERNVEAAFRVSGEPADIAPTPEPTTMVLVGAGLALGAWRRRQLNRPPLAALAPVSREHLCVCRDA